MQEGSVYSATARNDWTWHLGLWTDTYGVGSDASYAAVCVEYTVPDISGAITSATLSIPCTFGPNSNSSTDKMRAVLSTFAPPMGVVNEKGDIGYVDLNSWRWGPSSGLISNVIAFAHTDKTLTFNLKDGSAISGKKIYLYTYCEQRNTIFSFLMYAPDNGSLTYSDAEYSLSISSDSGCTVTVERTSSSTGSTGALKSGDKLYYGDKLKISYSAKSGYKITTSTVNGASHTSGNTITVSGNVSVVVQTQSTASKLSATDANIESVSTITINKANSSYKHTLTYEFGSLSGTIVDKTSNSSVGWTVPSDFYAQIPSSKSGICTITCEAFNSSGTSMGTSVCQMTVTAAYEKCKPSVSASITDTNSTSSSITGNSNILIRYLSNASCSITATGANGASIKSTSINGVSASSVLYEKVEIDKFVFSATDSRGYTTQVTIQPEMVQYVKLTINPVFTRPSVTSGEIHLTFDGRFYSGTLGDIQNTLTVRYRFRNIKDPAMGGWITIDSSKYTVGSGSHTYKSKSPIVLSDNNGSTTSFTYKNSYEFQIQAYDGGASATLSSASVTVPVGQGIPIFDWGAEDFSFNVPVIIGTGDLEDDSGVLKKFSNGIWVGNSGPLEASGEFSPQNGYTGIFINTTDAKTYIVQGSEMSAFNTGEFIARFA